MRRQPRHHVSVEHGKRFNHHAHTDNTEVLMARIDDYCKRHPLDNLYNASAALVDELRQ
jgi:hypothetical protein